MKTEAPLKTIYTNSTILKNEEINWYAIYTKSRFEKKINSTLQKSGFQTFLPLTKEKRKWSDRLKTVEVPLLPSYVFVKIAKTEFSQIYYHPGFVRFISFEGKPCIIHEKEISLLKNIFEHGYKVCRKVNCDFEVGDRVRIIRGPLKGWEGIIESKRGNSKVVFQFESFQQAIEVEVLLSHLEVVK